MAYFLPQALVFQEFQAVATAVADPLRAHVSGGNADLFRYSEADEKAKINLGAYDPLSDTSYSWPSRPTGGIVDQGYAKLFADDALLQYFEDLVGADSVVAPVAGELNQVRSDAVNFKENIVGSTTFARDALLQERDAQVGDIVDLRATVLSVTHTLRTSVQGFVGDAVAAVIAAATGDANNETTQVGAVSVSQTIGPFNCVNAAADSSSYDGSVDGDTDEVYTVVVTQGSVGTDPTTAKLRVTSASGNDDVAEVTPAAFDSPTTIGTRGLTLTFSDSSLSSCSLSAVGQGVSEDDLLEGQTWVVTVTQDFTAPTATSGGTYTGSFDTTYIVEVTRGGPFSGADDPQITVSTVHGVDVSGPTAVPAAATAVAVGSQGVTISFGGVGADTLRKGDIYYVIVTKETEGNMRTLVLANNLPTGMEAATDMDLTLYIKKTGLQIPRKRTGAPPTVNYDLGDPGVADTGFDVKSGITAFDTTWVDAGGDQLPLAIAEATLFMEYRAWLGTAADAVYSIADVGDLDDIPGPLDPDNELKWAVSKALANANGTDVRYTAVTDPDDTDAWQDVLDLLVGEQSVYGLVPLTYSKTIHDLYAAHATAQSSATAGRWRVVWATLQRQASTAVINATTSSDSATVLATVADDPDVAGDQFVIVDVPAGNAQFVTDGVEPGDLMRFNFSTDGWGDETYDEFVIDAVINEDRLRLKTAQGTVEVTVAKKMEVWRTLSATELAAQLAAAAAAFGSARVRAVWPDTVGSGGETFPGYHLAAALAGLRSGVAPNQGLTNLEVAGFDDMTATTNLFNRDQLDTMAESGVLIVTRNDAGNIVSRHALTSIGYGDVLTQEEMVIANVDSMSSKFLADVEDLIGRSNVTPSTLDLVELRVGGTISFFQEVRIERIGGQLIDGEITDIRQHLTLKDRVVVEVTLTVPVPLNQLELHLSIIA